MKLFCASHGIVSRGTRQDRGQGAVIGSIRTGSFLQKGGWSISATASTGKISRIRRVGGYRPTLDEASVKLLSMVLLPADGLPTRPIRGSRGMVLRRKTQRQFRKRNQACIDKTGSSLQAEAMKTKSCSLGQTWQDHGLLTAQRRKSLEGHRRRWWGRFRWRGPKSFRGSEVLLERGFDASIPVGVQQPAARASHATVDSTRSFRGSRRSS